MSYTYMNNNFLLEVANKQLYYPTDSFFTKKQFLKTNQSKLKINITHWAISTFKEVNERQVIIIFVHLH